MIRLEGICKTFRVARRGAGLSRAVKAFVKRDYQVIEALKDVSFTVPDGQIVGYIGPNGAGKSTTIKVMCGILTPDSGVCVIDGRMPWLERVQHVQHIGAVFGQRSQLWWDVPVGDSMALIRDIYKVDKKDYQARLDELTSLLNLEDLLTTPARSLSLGQRMRCELAASLLHAPRILFLDEPTIGLDAVSKLAVRGFIKRLNREQGTTVLLTTHDMQDIEALAQRILLIGKGRILLDGSLDDLKAQAGAGKTLAFTYTGAARQLCPGMTVREAAPGRLLAAIDTDCLSLSQAIAHISSQVEVTDIEVASISAEEMVASLYRAYQV
ncbi:MAG: ATP-binding cassette domain-containing protein [Clostridiales bacterium]|nr:ATP-binding cassette domain-containing protein [Clostridiales bacterium]